MSFFTSDFNLIADSLAFGGYDIAFDIGGAGRVLDGDP